MWCHSTGRFPYHQSTISSWLYHLTGIRIHPVFIMYTRQLLKPRDEEKKYQHLSINDDTLDGQNLVADVDDLNFEFGDSLGDQLWCFTNLVNSELRESWLQFIGQSTRVLGDIHARLPKKCSLVPHDACAVTIRKALQIHVLYLFGCEV